MPMQVVLGIFDSPYLNEIDDAEYMSVERNKYNDIDSSVVRAFTFMDYEEPALYNAYHENLDEPSREPDFILRLMFMLLRRETFDSPFLFEMYTNIQEQLLPQA